MNWSMIVDKSQNINYTKPTKYTLYFITYVLRYCESIYKFITPKAFLSTKNIVSTAVKGLLGLGKGEVLNGMVFDTGL
jgi:hypothetical protein